MKEFNYKHEATRKRRRIGPVGAGLIAGAIFFGVASAPTIYDWWQIPASGKTSYRGYFRDWYNHKFLKPVCDEEKCRYPWTPTSRFFDSVDRALFTTDMPVNVAKMAGLSALLGTGVGIITRTMQGKKEKTTENK